MKDNVEFIAAFLLVGSAATVFIAGWLLTRIWFWLGALTITLMMKGGMG